MASTKVFIRIEGKTAWDDLDPHQREAEIRKQHTETLSGLVKEYETEKGRPVSPEEFATFSAWVNEETERLFRDLTTFDIHNQEVDLHQWEADFRRQQEERLAKLVKENETEKGRPLSLEEFAELSAKVNEVTERVIRARTPFDIHKPVEEVDFHQWEPKVRKWYEEKLAEVVKQYETSKGEPISPEEFARSSAFLKQVAVWTHRDRTSFGRHEPDEE